MVAGRCGVTAPVGVCQGGQVDASGKPAAPGGRGTPGGRPTPGPIEALSAVTLAVSDMVRSEAFYRALGFDAVYGGPDSDFVSFRAGSGYVNLQVDPSHAPLTGIWGRVIVWVDDVDAMYDRVVAAGGTPTAPPRDAAWGERYFHVTDPDGHELSFARRLA